MNNDPETGPGGTADEPGFDLGAPSGDVEARHDKPPGLSDKPPRKVKAVPLTSGYESEAESRRQAAWKGFEEEPEEEEPAVEFQMKRDDSDDDMDMTPMVDVTFLLLIFFMVTASFTVIRSIEQPNPESDQPSETTVEQPEDQRDYVEVIIDQFNTFRITVRTEEEVEAPSNLEMQRMIRAAVNDYGPGRLVILAHDESALKKLVAVYSAARVNGISQIEMSTTDEDF